MDIVIGNDRKHDLVRLLEEYSLDSVNDTVDDINDGKHDFEELFIDQTKEHTRAFIKVQDGCIVSFRMPEDVSEAVGLKM